MELTRIEAARRAIKARRDNSAWSKGVTAYAIDILDIIEERARYEGSEPSDRATLEDYALNGATGKTLFDAWSKASWGGCYCCYDEDIATRLCSPSELRKTRNGELRPNAREQWLDVQARALYQAFVRLSRAYPFEEVKV